MKYIDADTKTPSAPYYEAIPVFYSYRTGTSGSTTYAGRVTFYSAPGVVFKDFHISFTLSGSTITYWNLTPVA